jgi:simple sugar transport system ATP-binding protein
VLGIAGVSGNGQSELAEVLTGMRHATNGSIRIEGEETLNFTPRQLYRRRLAHVPEIGSASACKWGFPFGKTA